MTNLRPKADIPSDIPTLRALCRSSIRRLIKQIKNERASGRSIAKKLRVSYTLIQLIVKNPDRILSRKVMIKILRATTRKQLIKPKLKTAAPGVWNHHAI